MLRSIQAIRFSKRDNLSELLNSREYKNIISDILGAVHVLFTSEGALYAGDYLDEIPALALQQAKECPLHFLDKQGKLYSPLEIICAEEEALKNLKRTKTRDGHLLYIAKNNRAYSFAKIQELAEKQRKCARLKFIDKQGNVLSPIEIQFTNKENLLHDTITGSKLPLTFSGSFLIQHEKTLLAGLSQRLLMASHGETYWLEDILLLSEEERKASSLTFQNKEGTEFSLAEMKFDADTLLQLIHNKALAEIFCTAHLTTEETWEWSKVEQQCGIYRVPAMIPAITPNEDIYEWRAMEEYFKTYDANDFPHPNPVFKSRLCNKQILLNKAVHDLIFLSFQEEIDKRLKENEKLKDYIEKLHQQLGIQTDKNKKDKLEKKFLEVLSQYKEKYASEKQVQKDWRENLEDHLAYIMKKISAFKANEEVSKRVSLLCPLEMTSLEAKLKEFQTKTTSLKNKQEKFFKQLIASVLIIGAMAVCSGLVMEIIFTLSPLIWLSPIAAGMMYALFGGLCARFIANQAYTEISELEKNVADISQVITFKKQETNFNALLIYEQQSKEISSLLDKLGLMEKRRDEINNLILDKTFVAVNNKKDVIIEIMPEKPENKMKPDKVAGTGDYPYFFSGANNKEVKKEVKALLQVGNAEKSSIRLG